MILLKIIIIITFFKKINKNTQNKHFQFPRKSHLTFRPLNHLILRSCHNQTLTQDKYWHNKHNNLTHEHYNQPIKYQLKYSRIFHVEMYMNNGQKALTRTNLISISNRSLNRYYKVLIFYFLKSKYIILI